MNRARRNVRIVSQLACSCPNNVQVWDGMLHNGTIDAEQEARIQAANENLIDLPPMPSSMVSISVPLSAQLRMILETQIKSSRTTVNNGRAALHQTANATTSHGVKTPGFPSNICTSGCCGQPDLTGHALLASRL